MPIMTTRRATAFLCAVVGTLAGAAAALGVFGRGDGAFAPARSALGEPYEIALGGVYADSSRQLVAEGVGWDVFTLFVAVPIMLAAALLVARGSFRGDLIAAGMLGYFIYMHLEYAVTWSFGIMFPLFVAICALSLTGLVAVSSMLAEAGFGSRFDERYPRRRFAALIGGMAMLLTVMWLARIADGLASETPALHGETTMTVQALDLGLVVPLSVVIALAVWRRVPVGLVAGAGFGVTFVMMAAAIAAMMLSASIVTGVPQVPPITVFGLAGAAGLLLLARISASASPAGAPRQLLATLGLAQE
jgi:hypothetical protein